MTKRSVDCILKEFAGADELSGCHSAEVGSVEGRVATALVASPVGEDATFYVRAVTPQIVLALIMRSINKSDQSPQLAAHSRVALDALSRLHERGFSHIVVASILGQFGHVSDENALAHGLSALGIVLRSTAQGLRETIAADLELIRYLVHLVAFAKQSRREVHVEAVQVLNCVIEISSDPVEIIFHAITRPCTISFRYGLRGGIISTISDKMEDVDAMSVLEVLNAPELVGALFALCLKKFLRWRRRCETADLSRVLPTLKLAANLSTQLDMGVLTAPGTDLVQTLGLVLSDAADGTKHLTNSKEVNPDEDGLNDDGEDKCSLERLALGTLLGILELGIEQGRSFEDEKSLRALLPSLAALSCPSRHNAETSQVAAQCRALIISRNCRTAPNETLVFAAQPADDMFAATVSNLSSPLPALRAFGVVQLTKLCESFVLDRDRRLVDGINLPKPISWCLIADVLLQALQDQESYVYLAAVHALAAVADANPREVLPWFLYTVRTLSDDLIKMRLGEALMLTIRRRGEAAPAYTRALSQSLCYSARYDQPIATRNASLSLLGELCGVAGLSVHIFAVDICDLVSSILDCATEEVGTKRAASYLGHRAIAGCGQPLLENAPRDCALMCKRLRIHALNSSDEIIRFHANCALFALDALLVFLLHG